MLDKENEAIRCYDLAEESVRSIGHSVGDRTKERREALIQIDNTSLVNTVMDRSAVFREIADIYLKQKDKNYSLALEKYEKALDSIDSLKQTFHYYQTFTKCEDLFAYIGKD
jgi:hypothetical protein